MKPIPVPEVVEQESPDLRKLRIGPPPNVSEEDCGSIEALAGYVKEQGVFDGSPVYRVFWKPDEEEIKFLQAGGWVELELYVSQMVVHRMSVGIANVDLEKYTEANRVPVVHAPPPTGGGIVPCCGRTPFEVPQTDRVAWEKSSVTCTGVKNESG